MSVCVCVCIKLHITAQSDPIDAMRETGEAWLEREKSVDLKEFGSVTAYPDNL